MEELLEVVYIEQDKILHLHLIMELLEALAHKTVVVVVEDPGTTAIQLAVDLVVQVLLLLGTNLLAILRLQEV